MRTEGALGLLAVMMVAATGRAQQPKSPTQTGSPATAPNSAVVSRIAAQQFEQGLSVALADPSTHAIGATRGFLQGVSLTWKAHPGVTHYRLQRSVQPSGPWVTIHDATGTGDGIGGLPPSTTFYARVLALQAQGRGTVGYAVVDSSAPVRIQTAAPFTPTGDRLEVQLHSCLPDGNGMVRLVWSPIPGLTRYVVTPYAVSPYGPPSSVYADTTNPGAPLVTADTIAFIGVVKGRTVLRVRGRAEFANWPATGQTMTMLTPIPYYTGSATVRQDLFSTKCE